MSTSEMQEVQNVLRTLYRIHRQLSDLESRLAMGPRQIKIIESRLAQSQAAAEDATKKTFDLRIATDIKQSLLDSSDANIKRRKSQLIEAKDNREYTALKNQIAADEAANHVLEDEILEALERLEVLKQNAEKARAELDKMKESAQASITQINEERQIITFEMARLQKELALAEQELPSDFMEIYTRIIRIKGHDGMAPLRDTFCGGCATVIPFHQIGTVIKGFPSTCNSCGRLLHTPEGYSPSGKK